MHTKMEAECKRTTVEQAQAISRGTGVCEKKSPQDEFRVDPLAPDHSMHEQAEGGLVLQLVSMDGRVGK